MLKWIKKPYRYFNVNIILSLIIVLNLVFGVVYYFAHPDNTVWENIWGYLGSSVFTLITGSLLIPLLLSFIEKQYKFIENLHREREEKRKEMETQRRRYRQEAIDGTIAMWQQLYSQTSEVIYFDRNSDKAEMNDLFIRMINFTSTAEHVVNKWNHQFPNLKPADLDVFLEFINMIYEASFTTIYYIKNSDSDEEVKTLQDMLFLIQDQVKTIANHRIIDTLKYAARIIDLKEDDAPEEKIQVIKDKMKFELDMLKDWAKAAKDLVGHYDNFLAPGEGDQIQKVREIGQNIRTWLKEDKSRLIFQYPEFTDFKDKYDKLSLEDRLRSARVPLSKEYLSNLAAWLSFESSCQYLYNNAHGTW